MTFLSVPQLVAEEIQAWTERERRRVPGTSAAALMSALAGRLGLTNERQVYRYMSGETPFPLEKAVTLCRVLSSWKLLQALNQDAGLIAEPKPDIGKIDGFDLVVELTRNLKESAELAAEFAKAAEAPPSEIQLRSLERESREAIQQAERLVAIYREMVAQRGARA